MKPKPYRIAVDARPFCAPMSGVSRVISRILLNFPDPGGFEFFLYASKPCHGDYRDVLALPYVRWRQGSGWTARKAGLWFNTAMPFTMRKDCVDLYWGSQQLVPPFLPAGLPVVLTFYDLVMYFFPQAMRAVHRLQLKAVLRYGINRADRILTISEQTRTDLLKKFHYPPDKARAALLGYERPPEKKGKHEKLSSPYILAVSTIEPRKNYTTLLKAYRQYCDSTAKPYTLVIAGRRGWESKEFFAMLGEMQEKYSVRVMENLDDGSLRRLYENCAFFCMPSLYEGFGLPLLEALAASKQAIVSDLPCFHEIGGEKIRYLPPVDISSWAKALAETADLHKRGKLKKIKFDEKKWSWKKTAALHRAAFAAVLSESSIISQLPSKTTPSAI